MEQVINHPWVRLFELEEIQLQQEIERQDALRAEVLLLEDGLIKIWSNLNSFLN